MSSKVWEERRPGYHSYFYSNDRAHICGDVRAVNTKPNAPCEYEGQVYSPMPKGTKVGIFATLNEAKAEVQKQCNNFSL